MRAREGGSPPVKRRLPIRARLPTGAVILVAVRLIGGGNDGPGRHGMAQDGAHSAVPAPWFAGSSGQKRFHVVNLVGLGLGDVARKVDCMGVLPVVDLVSAISTAPSWCSIIISSHMSWNSLVSDRLQSVQTDLTGSPPWRGDLPMNA